MMRYFFNVEGVHAVRDEIGLELPDQRTGEREALVFLAELLRYDEGFLEPDTSAWSSRTGRIGASSTWKFE